MLPLPWHSLCLDLVSAEQAEQNPHPGNQKHLSRAPGPLRRGLLSGDQDSQWWGWWKQQRGDQDPPDVQWVAPGTLCIVEMQNQVLIFTCDGQSYAFSFEYEKQLHQMLKAVQLVLWAQRFSSSSLGLSDAWEHEQTYNTPYPWV